jgi:hypothetical protein
MASGDAPTANASISVVDLLYSANDCRHISFWGGGGRYDSPQILESCMAKTCCLALSNRIPSLQGKVHDMSRSRAGVRYTPTLHHQRW